MCAHCGQPSGGTLLVCEPCRHHHVALLVAIAHALGYWQHESRSAIPAVRYDREWLSGSRSDAGQSVFRSGEDVVAELWAWAGRWAELIGQPVPAGSVTEWLAGRLTWAIQNSDVSEFPEFSKRLIELRYHARRVTGLLPERLGPCMHCGGALVRDWSDEHWEPNIEGRSDVVRCSRCNRRWQDRAGQLRALRGALHLAPSAHPDATVTLDDARKVFSDVPAATWRSWKHREQLPEPADQDVAGRPLYRLGDLAELTDSRKAIP